MESSRIFIRGLPPSLTAEDFEQHFSKQASVTDVKFIPHRRIGYVGYKSPVDAAKAVKYHNKSFIRLSRIGVELARSVEEQSALRLTSNHVNGGQKRYREELGESTTNTVVDDSKRKRDAPSEHEGKAKLQEFLDVMKPPSKSKTWENQDVTTTNAATGPNGITVEEVEYGKQSDGEYEPVPKKRKGERRTTCKMEEARMPAHLTNGASDVVEKMPDLLQISEEKHQESTGENPLEERIPAASDADWLRSRTSRLLGLVDDEDTFSPPKSQKDEEHLEDDVSTARENVNGAGRSDASVQTDEANNNEDVAALKPKAESHEGPALRSRRLFIRNLTYTMTEDDLRQHFESGGFGTIEEVHLSIDSRSGSNKGFAHLLYTEPEAAGKALHALDNRPFQGRLLHVMLAKPKKENGLDEFAISKLPLKKQQQIKRKAEAASSIFNWNSMYMNTDAVISSISDRLGVSKSELLDPTSSGAAVKQAHAETHIIQETKYYFTNHGVDLDAFKRKERGDTAILVKNFSYGTKPEDLKQLFEPHGKITQLLMPPSGTIAIIEFEQADHARSAFGSLAYRKFKESILFLEKAPVGLFAYGQPDVNGGSRRVTQTKGSKPSATELLEGDDTQQPVNTSTLFVRNLNFITTTKRLQEVFKPLDGFLSAKVKTKPDPKKQAQTLSMGFGFLEFQSKDNAQAALTAMDGYKLDGHELLIRASHKAVDAAEERRKEDHAKKTASRKTKIIIKNLPFEASKKDVQSLFGAYGQLRSVRVPKKFDSSTRGFAFADFVTAREAENAMDALKDTHLLGRRLILEFAAADAIDPEQEIDKMQQKVGKQADKVALQRLTGSGRTKFNVEGGGDELDQG